MKNNTKKDLTVIGGMKLNNYNQKAVFSIIWVILGAMLMALSSTGWIDEFWSGMGGALLFIGILQLLRHIKYYRNKDYREKFDTEVSDERNHFISTKAWAWAGYAFVLIAALATIAFKLMGQETLMMASAMSVSLLIVFYWISYIVLKKKY